MCINMEDLPQAVLQLYIYLRKEYNLDDVDDEWERTKYLTLISMSSSLAGISFGASFTLLQLTKLYHEANPKNKKKLVATKKLIPLIEHKVASINWERYPNCQLLA